MELYDQIIKIADDNVVFCLVPLLLALVMTEFLFKDRFQTKKTLSLIRWFIICYTIAALIRLIAGITIFHEESAFINRATGPYMILYWLMFFAAGILPFTLFVNKLASGFLYVLFISVLMKIGFYFERYVIIVSGCHSDYRPDGGNFGCLKPLISGIAPEFLKGFIFAILILSAFEITNRNKIAGSH